MCFTPALPPTENRDEIIATTAMICFGPLDDFLSREEFYESQTSLHNESHFHVASLPGHSELCTKPGQTESLLSFSFIE